MPDLLAWAIGLMVTIAFVVGLSYVIALPPCEAKAKRMGLRYEYGLLEGCMVKVDNRWIPLDSYRVVAE